MRWTEDQVEQWVAELAALDFSTPTRLLCPVPEDTFPHLLERVVGEQLEGLLVRAVQTKVVDLDDCCVERVAAKHGEAMARTLLLERAALAGSEVLDSAGVRHVLLKGAALATAVYADASLRPFGDVDLLLEPARVVDGIAALRAAGAVRWLPEVRRGFDGRFAKDIPVLFGGGGLDLHRTLIAGPLGRRIPVDELIARRREVLIGGRSMSMLDLADAYVHAGLTAGAADVPARLITLRDLLELEATPGFDVGAVITRVRAWGAEAPVARAVRLVDDRLRPDRPPALAGWARAHVAGPGGPVPDGLLHEHGPQLPPPAGRGGVHPHVARPGRPAPRAGPARAQLPARPGLDPPSARRARGEQAHPLSPLARRSFGQGVLPSAGAAAGSVGGGGAAGSVGDGGAASVSGCVVVVAVTSFIVDASDCGTNCGVGSTQNSQMMSPGAAVTLVVTPSAHLTSTESVNTVGGQLISKVPGKPIAGTGGHLWNFVPPGSGSSVTSPVDNVAQVAPQVAVAEGKYVASLQHFSNVPAQPHSFPVCASVTVIIGEQPVTVWAWAVPADRTWTTGVVQVTTPAATAAFLRAVRRSVAPTGASVS